MKENNLEKKILKEVYSFEKRRTFLMVSKYLLVIAGVGYFFYVTLSMLLRFLHPQIRDILSLFKEDSEVVTNNMGDVAATLYEYAPKELLILLTLSIVVLLIGIILFVLNFNKIKNRIKAIIRRR